MSLSPRHHLSKISRCSHQRCSIKKDALKIFAKFIEKHVCQILFFNKVAVLRPEPCNFVKKETLAQVFFCEFCEIFKITSFTEHLCVTAFEYLRTIRDLLGKTVPKPLNFATILHLRLLEKIKQKQNETRVNIFLTFFIYRL